MRHNGHEDIIKLHNQILTNKTKKKNLILVQLLHNAYEDIKLN